MDDTLNDSDIFEKSDVVQVDSQTDEETTAGMVRSEESIQQTQVDTKSDVAQATKLHCKTDPDVRESAEVIEDERSDCSLITHCSDNSPPKKPILPAVENIVIESSDEEKEGDTPSQCQTLPVNEVLVGKLTEENLRCTSDCDVDMFASQLESSQDQTQCATMECEDIIPSTQEDIDEDISCAQISNKSLAEITSRLPPCKRKLENGEESAGKILCVEKCSSNERRGSPIITLSDDSLDKNGADSRSDKHFSAHFGAGDEKLVEQISKDNAKIVIDSGNKGEIACKNVGEDANKVDKDVSRNKDENVKSKDEIIIAQDECANVVDTSHKDILLTDAEPASEMKNNVSAATSDMLIDGQSDVKKFEASKPTGKHFQLNFNLKVNKIHNGTSFSVADEEKSDMMKIVDPQDISECDEIKSNMSASGVDKSQEDKMESGVSASDFHLETNVGESDDIVKPPDLCANVGTLEFVDTKSESLNSVKPGIPESHNVSELKSNDLITVSDCNKAPVISVSDNMLSNSFESGVSKLKAEASEENKCEKVVPKILESLAEAPEPQMIPEMPKSEIIINSPNLDSKMSEAPLSKNDLLLKASKSEDIISKALMSDDLIPDASKSDDIMLETAKIMDISKTSKSEAVVFVANMSEVVALKSCKVKNMETDLVKDTILAGAAKSDTEPAHSSKLENITDASESENMATVASKLQNVTSLSKLDDDVTSTSKLEDVMSAAKLDNVMSASTLDNVMIASKLDDVTSASTLKDVTGTLKSDDLLTAQTKSEGIAAGVSKLEGMEKETPMLEDMETDASELEDAETHASKLEYMKPDASKLEGMETDSSKLEGKETDVSKLKDKEADASKLKDKEADASMLKYKEADASKLKYKEADASKLKDKEADASKMKDKETDASKLKDKEAYSSKLEGKEADVSKWKDKEADVSKWKDEEADASKLKDEEADASKLKDEEADASKLKDEEADASKLKDEEADASKLKDEEADASKMKDEEADAFKWKDMEADASKLKDMESDASKLKDMETDAYKLKCMETDEYKLKCMETDSSKLKCMETDASKLKDMETDAYKLKDIETDAYTLKDIETDACTLKDMKTNASTLKEMETEASKSEEDVSVDLSKSQAVAIAASNSMNMVTDTLKLDYIAKGTAISKKIATDSSRSADVPMNTSELVEVSTDTVKLNDMLTNTAMSNDVAADTVKSSDRAIGTAKSNEVITTDMSKSEAITADLSKSDAMAVDSSKLETMVVDSFKSEAMPTDTSKSEAMAAYTSKLEDTATELSKSVDLETDTSKLEMVAVAADTYKSEDKATISTKFKSTATDVSKFGNMTVGSAKSEDVGKYASSSCYLVSSLKSRDTNSGVPKSDDHVNTTILKSGKVVSELLGYSEIKCFSASDDVKSDPILFSEVKSVKSKSGDVTSNNSNSNSALSHTSNSDSETPTFSKSWDKESNPRELKSNLSTLTEVKSDFSKLDELKCDFSKSVKLKSGSSVLSDVINIDSKLKSDVSQSDNGKRLKLFESSSRAVQEVSLKQVVVASDEHAVSDSNISKCSPSPVKQSEGYNFVHPRVTPSKCMGQGTDDEFDADGSMKSNYFEVSDSQDLNLCISLSPNTSTQSTDNMHQEKIAVNSQRSQDNKAIEIMEIDSETVKENKTDESSKMSSSEKTNSDNVMSNGFADTHEVMLCSPSDRVCDSNNIDNLDDSISIICEEDTRPTRKKDDSIAPQVKRKRQNNDADIIEYIDIAVETPPQPEVDEHHNKKRRTLEIEEKNSPLQSTELCLQGSNSAFSDRIDSSFENEISTLTDKAIDRASALRTATAVQCRRIAVVIDMNIVYDKHTKEVISKTVTQCEDLRDDVVHPTSRSSEISSGYLADTDGKISPGSVTSTGPYMLMPKQLSRLSTTSTSSSSTTRSFGSGDLKHFSHSWGGSTIMPPPKEIPKERCPSREDGHHVFSPLGVIKNYEPVIQFLDQVTVVDNLNSSDYVCHSDDSKKLDSKTSSTEISSSSDANRHIKVESDEKHVPETVTPKTSRKTYTRVAKRSGPRVKVIPESKDNESPSVVESGEKLEEGSLAASSPQVGRSSRRARNKLGFDDTKSPSISSTPTKTPASSDRKASQTGLGRRRTGPDKDSAETQMVEMPKTPEKPETPMSESISSEPKTPERLDGVRGDQIEVGVAVFARWTDKKYYSGKVKNKVREKWLVEFDDGSSKTLIPDFIIVCTELNRGQSVYAMDRHGDFHSGVIRDFKLSKGEVVYGVELDDTEEQLFVPLSKIALSEDQANLLRESAYDASFTSLTPKGSSSVTLDNLVEGKRARKLPQVQLQRPHSSGTSSNIKPRRARSDASSLSDTGDKISSASDFVGGVEPESYPNVDMIVTCNDTGKTLTKGGKSTTKSSGKSKSKASEDPDILSLLGPIPPDGSNIFAGRCFLLTCSDIDNHFHAIPKRKTASGKKGKKRSSEECSSSEVSSDDPVSVPFDKNRLTRQLTAGGGVVYENFHDVPEDKYSSCLLIANKALQTAKYLLCLAHNIPILQHKWIIDSVKKGSEIVERTRYYLHAGWSLEDEMYKEWKSFPRMSRKPLHGLNVYIVNEAGIFFKFWNKILTALGASATHLVDSQDLAAKPDVVLTDLSCFEEVVREAELNKIPLVSTTWVVQCLINWRRCGYNAHVKYRYNAPD